MDWRDRIVADPAVLMGKPTVKGTRIAVQFLLGLFAQGWSSEDVLKNYTQLSSEDLKAVFAYGAARMKDEELQLLKG